jgi:phosphate transport system substrate-binding protein
MRQRQGILFLVCVSALILLPCLFPKAALAEPENVLRYSCSAQVHEAFGEEGVRAFSKATGTKVFATMVPSREALALLARGYTDIASVAEELDPAHAGMGMVAVPFCKDWISVIVHPDTGIKNIERAKLPAVFSKEITNWKELGGPDQEIVLVVPGLKTAASNNFQRLVMEGREIKYDVLCYQSTFAIKTVQRIPWSISFISHGAAWDKTGVRELTLDGRAPGAKDYPLFQMFSFVTKGEAKGRAKTLVEFATQGKGVEIITRRGMVPAGSVK